MNLSSLDVNLDCDNTTLIQPPRVAPYNGSSINKSSLVLISDDENSASQVSNNQSFDGTMIINDQDRICITAFLSSFPDVSLSLITIFAIDSCRPSHKSG